MMENPINPWDDLGVPLFLETPISPCKMNHKKQSKLRKSQYLTVTLQDQLLPKNWDLRGYAAQVPC